MAEQEALEVPAVLVAELWRDLVDPSRCQERTAVTAQVAAVAQTAVVQVGAEAVAQALAMDQAEVLLVPWERPFWRLSLHPKRITMATG